MKQGVFKDLEMRMIFVKLLVLSLSPVGLLIFSYLIWLLIFFLKYKLKISEHKSEFINSYITTIVIVLFMVHPNIIETSISVFSCTNIGF